MKLHAQEASVRRNQKVVAFHSNAAIQDQKYEGEELNTIRRLSERRMMLTRAAALLSMFGLILTAISSEVCSYGYVPTETEMLEGMEDPYTSPSAGCGGEYAYKLWLMKIVISFSTVLLSMVVVVRYHVAYQEQEKAIMHVARHSDPPDISALNRQHRRDRFREFLRNILLELLLTVMPHPFPGVKKTFRFWPALQRGRFWHVWRLMKATLFY